jgi:hypothetical protein
MAKKRGGVMPGIDWRDLKKRVRAMQERVIPQAQSIIFT